MELRGVNLGGWLVLERWITPTLFKGYQSWDEYSYCIEAGANKDILLKKHWDTFIQEKDIRWIASNNLNAVRIPVGYWIFGDVAPYVRSIENLDWLIEIAEKYDLKVVINLHGAQGSQNGYKHSGKEGNITWHKDKDNIDQTLNVIKRLAERYAKKPAFEALELLNEPSSKIRKSILINYYNQAYQKIRQYSKNTKVIISDGFQPKKWKKELSDKNIWLDMHLYQCFDKKDKKLDINGHLRKVAKEWRPLLEEFKATRPVIVGEWSAALSADTFNGMDSNEKSHAINSYFMSQLKVFNKMDGWFYWTYKSEQNDTWNFKYLVETAQLPLKF